MSQNEKTAQEDAKFRRSPSFPVLPIDEAIDKVRQIYRADKRAFTSFQTLVSHLCYTTTKKGGRPARAVSALKQYGLLDERNGQYRVSELAWKILEMAEGTPEKENLIKEAALSPPMFRKILNLYSGELPSDATIRDHLLFRERFNTDGARDFITVLRRTIELVKPSQADYNTGEESEGEEGQSPIGARPVPQQPITSPSTPSQRPTGMPTPPSPPIGQVLPPADGFQFQISERSVNVLFNGLVTQEAIKKLIKYLEISVDDFPSKKELEKAKSMAEVDQALDETERELNEGVE